MTDVLGFTLGVLAWGLLALHGAAALSDYYRRR